MSEMCKAEEWQRDGRGLWAMRACVHQDGKEHHPKGKHEFGAWRYYAHPPGGAAKDQQIQALTAERDALRAQVKYEWERHMEYQPCDRLPDCERCCEFRDVLATARAPQTGAPE